MALSSPFRELLLYQDLVLHTAWNSADGYPAVIRNRRKHPWVSSAPSNSCKDISQVKGMPCSITTTSRWLFQLPETNKWLLVFSPVVAHVLIEHQDLTDCINIVACSATPTNIQVTASPCTLSSCSSNEAAHIPLDEVALRWDPARCDSLLPGAARLRLGR